MSRSLRHLLVWLHVVSSVSWLSQAIALTVLLLVSAFSPPGDRKTGAAATAELLDQTVLVHSANTSAFTGLILAAVTAWGYLHYWWVGLKFVLTLGQLYLGIFVLSAAMHETVAATEQGSDGLALSLAVASGVMVVGLAFQVWLSVAKPWGRTPLGERARARPVPAPAWLYALGVLAPLGDVATGVALGNPAPILSLVTLILALVTRARRTRKAAVPVALDQDTRTGVIDRVTRLTPEVVAVRIACEAGPWEPGAHIDLVLPSGKTRQYSLCGDPADRTGYEIAVLREDEGRGASREIHALTSGDTVRIGGPRNNFPLVDAPAYLFVAGGIGVTPFLPMIARLTAEGRPWQLIHRGRSRDRMPFTDDLERAYGHRVRVLPSDTTPRPDFAALLAEQPDGTAVYCCGPESLMRALSEHAGPTLHLERFAATDRSDAPAPAFDLYLSRTHRVVRVPESVSALDALRTALPTAPGSCENGLCGSCVLRVEAGHPDHRTEVARDSATVFHPCVSRSRGPLLVVDA
ncbi:PDR/VanB family oxidoreductase [Nocardia sp. NPDC058176]|uniref:PDR/VanB family oxidoreductase n=1 Tax=Nocardia sp. NPDC058176 TaxID=3346368 RepID=UPI0036D8770F